MTIDAQIVVATSIPPRLSRRNAGRTIDNEYQKLCIQSWLDCGFRVLAVNDREEIPDLAARYPEVSFLATDRNASAISGRKNPFVADLLSALLASPASVMGIINSDIVFEPVPAWQRRLPSLVDNGVVTGQRLDTISLADGVLEKHQWGYDYFFFDRGAAHDLVGETLPWTMGLPWWDYWLPLTLAARGRKLVAVDRPSIVHLYHDTVYDKAVWRQFALMLSERVIRESEICRSPLPRSIAAVLPLCREVFGLSGSAEIERGAADELVQRLADTCAKSIRSELIDLETTTEPSPRSGPAPNLDPASIFAGYQIRTAAGRAVTKAKNLQLEDKTEEADKQYRAALEKMPNDSDVLFSYGDFLLRQHKPAQAAVLFRKLVGLRPDFCNGINAFGVALDNMGRLNEAITCFERALQLDPEFAATYFNLALALHKIDRHEDVVRRFENMLAGRPGVTAGAETYYQLQQKLLSLNGRSTPQLPEYFSHRGEDALLDKFFGFKDSGFFVDIGAGDGIHLSNSYAFERRGWTGLCIEAAPELFGRCVKNRPRSHCRKSLQSLERPGESPETEVDFMSINAPSEMFETLADSNLGSFKPRVVLIAAQTEQDVLDGCLAALGYRPARTREKSHFYVRDEADRNDLRAVKVSAKLAPAAVPLHVEYVYWPREA